MYKVMLIDDDVPMLKLLEQMIDWEQLNLHVVGVTYSSTKAQSMFRETMPDIVISDIGLPKKDGIELAGEFAAIKPNVRIIFLTCHEDFHYAQKALKLDADDYLIKDKLTAEQLMQSLRKSITLLNPREFGVEQKMTSYSMDIYKKGLFKRIKDGFNPELTIAHADQLGIQWSAPHFILAIANLSQASSAELYTQKDYSLIVYGIYNIAQELANGYDGITVFLEQENVVFTYNYRSNLVNNASKTFEGFIHSLQNKIAEYLKAELLVFMLKDQLELRLLGKLYKKIVEDKVSFYSKGQLIKLEPNQLEQVFFIPEPSFFEEKKVELERVLLKQDAVMLQHTMNKLSQTLASSNMNPKELVSLLLFHLRGLEAVFAKKKLAEDYFSQILHVKTLDEVMLLLEKCLMRMMESRVKQSRVVVQEPKLQVIQHYIDQHISQNITSIDVAKYLYLNPSYFSRYFKRLTGVNFTDYVHQYKMKMAEKILKTSNQSLESLSLSLGYSDRTYFSKVFKKYVGVTPSEYKAELGQ